MKKVIFMTVLTAFLVPSSIVAQCVAPSVSCSGTDPGNTFLNATNPNTIEYDPIVSTFHSTMARQTDGKVLVWGEEMAANGVGNVLTPLFLNSNNYPLLTGEILKFAGGSSNINFAQRVVLTTDGLFVWGTEDVLVSTDLTASASFQKLVVGGKTDGLPSGVSPGDVKMLFGSYEMLGLVTCSGDVWTLVNYNIDKQTAVGASPYIPDPAATAAAYGDGTAYVAHSTDVVWHQVKTNATTALDNVVALRGNGAFTFMALKGDGSVWTWGYKTFLGDGTAETSRPFATQMTLPAGVTPKMIGTTAEHLWGVSPPGVSSYYLLATNGNLYALGNNDRLQLGDFTSVLRTSWIQVKKSATSGDYLTNIAWISPNEHDGSASSGINVLTGFGELWAWGHNDANMLGGSSSTAINPTRLPGGLSSADKIIAVETGGHTSIIVKQCTGQFGYVGHRVHGSMADNTTVDEHEDIYNFTETSVLNLCGASSDAAVLFPVANSIITGQKIQLSFAPAGGTFSIAGPATVSTTGELIATGTGAITVTYTVTGNCGTTSSSITTNASGPLGVSFGDIRAQLSNNVLVVDWTTLKEENNSHFLVEISADGRQFTGIGELKTQSLNGNSSESLHYHFSKNLTGNSALFGIGLMTILGLSLFSKRRWLFSAVFILALGALFTGCKKSNAPEISNDKIFIRIVQVDIDGKQTYSKVISVIDEAQ